MCGRGTEGDCPSFRRESGILPPFSPKFNSTLLHTLCNLFPCESSFKSDSLPKRVRCILRTNPLLKTDWTHHNTQFHCAPRIGASIRSGSSLFRFSSSRIYKRLNCVSRKGARIARSRRRWVRVPISRRSRLLALSTRRRPTSPREAAVRLERLLALVPTLLRLFARSAEYVRSGLLIR